MTEHQVDLNTDRKATALACRIVEAIEPRDTVLDILKGMDEWYNGFDFLWRSGGWSGSETIPLAYRETFKVNKERDEFYKELGIPSLHGYVTTACIMQCARWFSGYPSGNRARNILYNATARALALSLGAEDKYESRPTDWDNYETVVISYNDAPGRSFAGIRDAIGAAIHRVMHTSPALNYSLVEAEAFIKERDADFDTGVTD